MDKSTDIVQAIERIAYFYKHESCGQCTPCREGTAWIWQMLGKLKEGEYRALSTLILTSSFVRSKLSLDFGTQATRSMRKST